MAQWLLGDGTVFDGESRLPRGTAVAVDGERIAAVGAVEELRTDYPAAEYVDLSGRLLTPGFTDAHAHPVQGGMERLSCDLSGLVDQQATLDRIAAYASGTDRDWVVGGGWDMTNFDGGVPSAELLDSVVSDRPAFLINRDHHGAWANTLAMKIAGLDATTPNPSDGRLERYADGRPTGSLHEGAMDLVLRHVPDPTPEEVDAGLAEAQGYLGDFGVTAWQDAIVGSYANIPDVGDAYVRAAERGTLRVRVGGALWWPRSTTLATIDEQVAAFAARRDADARPGYRASTIKIMLDGVCENHTAAMLSPYLSPHGHSHGHGPDRGLGDGLAYFDRVVLLASVEALAAAGFDVHMHAIGDRAVRDGLDAVQHARSRGAGAELRHHLAHIRS